MSRHEEELRELRRKCLELAAPMMWATDGTTASATHHIETYVRRLEKDVLDWKRAADLREDGERRRAAEATDLAGELGAALDAVRRAAAREALESLSLESDKRERRLLDSEPDKESTLKHAVWRGDLAATSLYSEEIRARIRLLAD